jgi:probable rRNA maturation factor
MLQMSRRGRNKEAAMEVIIHNEQQAIVLESAMQDMLHQVVAQVALVYGLADEAEVGITLVDDAAIHEMNRQYRGKDSATDVLSFALNDGEEQLEGNPAALLLGDIILSLETAMRQAEEYGHSLEREMAYLTVHGMLHLLGYDHECEAEKNEMRQEEEHVLMLLGIGRE